RLNEIISNVEGAVANNAQLVQYLNQTNSTLQASIARLKEDAAGASAALQRQTDQAAVTKLYTSLINASIAVSQGDTVASNHTVAIMGKQLQVVISAVDNVKDKDC